MTTYGKWPETGPHTVQYGRKVCRNWCPCGSDYIHKVDLFISQYRFYGEQVVKAAVENGCHHLDISGEPEVR